MAASGSEAWGMVPKLGVWIRCLGYGSEACGMDQNDWGSWATIPAAFSVYGIGHALCKPCLFVVAIACGVFQTSMAGRRDTRCFIATSVLAFLPSLFLALVLLENVARILS